MVDNYRLWKQHENSHCPKAEVCGNCGGLIYYGDNTHEADECIEIDGQYICRDCIEEYMMQNYKVVLEV